MQRRGRARRDKPTEVMLVVKSQRRASCLSLRLGHCLCCKGSVRKPSWLLRWWRLRKLIAVLANPRWLAAMSVRNKRTSALAKEVQAPKVRGFDWPTRRCIVFDEVTPSTMKVIERINNEGRVWREAGLLKGDLEGFFAGLSMWVVRE